MYIINNVVSGKFGVFYRDRFLVPNYFNFFANRIWFDFINCVLFAVCVNLFCENRNSSLLVTTIINTGLNNKVNYQPRCQ